MTKHDLQTYRDTAQELRNLKKLEREVEALDENTAKVLADTKKRLADQLQRIEDAIASLDPTERDILRLRYIKGCSWTKIAQCVHYSRSAAFDIHAEALRKLAEREGKG